MATHIVDLSARSEVLRNEPLSAHSGGARPVKPGRERVKEKHGDKARGERS